uniref:Uncharacterized protein n=1 Tax=Anguilla anguilla TaxID=7936 RepID=A0A0E9X1C8_ANGAN
MLMRACDKACSPQQNSARPRVYRATYNFKNNTTLPHNKAWKSHRSKEFLKNIFISCVR